MIRNLLSLSISAVSVLSILATTACGQNSAQDASTAATSKSTAEVQRDLESARSLTLSCNGSTTPLNQLALELSKKCRAQNAELKAKGMPACRQDECSDIVSLRPASNGLPGASLVYDKQGNTIGFQVVISTQMELSNQEKTGLICYAPVLKAQELLTSMPANCK